MTGPTDRDQATRDRLAEVAVRAAGCRHMPATGWGVAFCDAHDEDGNPPWDRCRWVAALDALLPVVADLEAKAAAEALETAAEWLDTIGEAVAIGHYLRLRAAALRAPRAEAPS